MNHYLVHYPRRGSRGWYVKSFLAPDVISYKKYFLPYVKEEIKKQEWIMPEDPYELIEIRMVFYFDRRRKDPNNYFKVPLDVLSEAGVWLDDDVALPVVDRMYIDSEFPRIEIEIRPLKNKGIFDDDQDRQSFVDRNCSGCSKWRNGRCGIYTTLLSNKLHPSIDYETDTCLDVKQKVAKRSK